MVTLQLDVDELERLVIGPRLFAFNKKAVCSVWTSDYLIGEGSLRQRVEGSIGQQGVTERPSRITLVTMPRLFGYVFNPVSFLICFDAQGKVIACVTQVNNTFGETHLYPLVCSPSAMPVTWQFPKKFFVSPFFDTEGNYTVILGDEGKRLSVQVDLEKQGSRVFSAILEGEAKPLTRLNLITTLAVFPLTQLLTMPRIHLQALFLFFKVRATPFLKPKPSDPYTIRSQQNIIHRLRLGLLSLLRASRSNEEKG
jgi:cyclopropane-fatty-acyl-phospholipid synthase